MKTIVVNVPDKKESYVRDFFKKNRLKMYVIEEAEDEDIIAKWIDEGMKSEEISEEEIFEIFRKNGIKV